MTWRIDDIKGSAVASLNAHLLNVPKKSKYANEKIVIDGIRFDSKKESRRYVELRMLLKAGVGELRSRNYRIHYFKKQIIWGQYKHPVKIKSYE